MLTRRLPFPILKPEVDVEPETRTMHITVEKISRSTTDRDAPTTKWVAYIDGKVTAEALTRRDALRWARQHANWLSR
jgi:hypothetical protein